MSEFDDVGAFHEKFGLRAAAPSVPRGLDDAARDFRLRFLLEELAELADGYGLELAWELREGSGAPDLPKIADALVDLVWVALGAAQLHALPWPALWADVRRANMSKRRAEADGSDSARGSPLDVVKPEGWAGPRTVEVLAEAGWPGPAPSRGEK
jgi:predicted HAD superfamily Cof-like phosphohydrolase